jgi:hypothetical protein
MCGWSRIRVVNRRCGLLISLTLWGVVTALAADPRPLTVDEARELAQVALPSLTARLPGLYLDNFKDPYYPGFYFFEAQWNGTGDISPVAGHYAVDSRTGDVWNAIICRELKTRALKRRQAFLRKKIGLTPERYRRIRRLGPECEGISK